MIKPAITKRLTLKSPCVHRIRTFADSAYGQTKFRSIEYKGGNRHQQKGQVDKYIVFKQNRTKDRDLVEKGHRDRREYLQGRGRAAQTKGETEEQGR